MRRGAKDFTKRFLSFLLALCLFASSLPVTIFADSKIVEHKATVHYFVSINAGSSNSQYSAPNPYWVEVAQNTVTNWTEKSEGYFNPVTSRYTGRFYLTQYDLEDIYGAFGFDASSYNGELIFPHTDNGGGKTQSGSVWADTPAKQNTSTGNWMIPLSSRTESYVYYIPNNVEGKDGYVEIKTGNNQYWQFSTNPTSLDYQIRSSNAFYTFDVTDNTGGLFDDDSNINQSSFAFGNDSKEVTLPYRDDVSYVVYNAEEKEVTSGFTKTISDDNSTITFSFPTITENIYIRLLPANGSPTAYVSFYVNINEKWVQLNTIKTTSQKTFGNKKRYYVTPEQIQDEFNQFGIDATEFESSDYIGTTGMSVFPHADTNGSIRIWADANVTKDSDGNYFIPVSNRLQSYLYYAPNGLYDSDGSVRSDKSGLISAKINKTSNSFYTVKTSDPKGLAMSELPEMDYWLSGTTQTITLPALADDGYYSAINEFTGDYLKPTEVENDDGTFTLTFEGVSCPIVIKANSGLASITYKSTLEGQIKDFLQFPASRQQLAKDCTINGVLEYGEDLTSSSKYIVLAPDSDIATVRLTGSGNNGRYFIYSFKGWKIGDTTTVVQPGEEIDSAILKDAANSSPEKEVVLTAVWSLVDTNKRGTTVNFYLDLDCEIMDNMANGFTNVRSEYFTDSVFQTRIFNTDTIPAEKGSNFLVLAPPTSSDTAYDVDNALRNTHNTPIDGLTLENFPTDEEVLEKVRLNNEQINIDGNVIPTDELTTENFKIRWYVLKYEQSDSWHIDGVLVAKQARLVIQKTFEGDDEAIASAEEGFNITVDHEETAEDGTVSTVTDYTLSLNPNMAETEMGKTGYYAYDVDSHTYTWVVNGRQQREYIIKENNYIVDQDKFNHTNRYKIENGSVEMDDWAEYDVQNGIKTTAVAYPSDMPETSFQRVMLQNMYVQAGTLTVSKVDSVTKNGIKNVSFKLSRVDGEALQVYKKPGKAEYSTDHTAVTEGYTEEVENNIVTTDANGNFYIKLAINDIGTTSAEYYLEEVTPLGYTGPKKIKVQVSDEGKITMLSTVMDDLDGDESDWIEGEHTAHLIIKNKSALFTTVKAEKDWGTTADTNKKPVKVELFRNGAKLVGSEYTQTLDATNNWNYEWHNLPIFIDGELAKYSIKETYIGDSAYDPTDDEDGYLDYMVSYDAPLYNHDGGDYHDTEYWTDDDGNTVFANNAYLKVHNEELNGNIGFNKIDAATGAPLAGAIFGLYSDAACETTALATAESGTNGFVVFASRPAGTYYIKELSAPDGFEVNESIVKVVISGGVVTITNLSDDTNTPIGTIANDRSDENLLFSFYKVNENDEALSGAHFGIYKLTCRNQGHNHGETLITVDEKGNLSKEDAKCWKLVDTCESAADTGLVLLDKLSATSTYRLVEYKSPSYYKLPVGQWQIKYDKTQEKFIPTVVGQSNLAPAFENIDDETVPYRLANYPLRDLPSSGKFGIGKFLIVGFCIIITAMAVIFYLEIRKRKGSSGNI